MRKMPVFPVDEIVADLNDGEADLFRAVLNKRTGALRASKPYRMTTHNHENAVFEACANYMWRMLCFDFCDWHPHVCMPVTADWDILSVNRGREDQHEFSKVVTSGLDALIKRIEAHIPVTAQRGIMRWARVY